MQLDPLTVWLREEFGNRAFFPDAANSKFDLPSDVVRLSVSLIVEGADPAVPGTSSASSVPVTTTPIAPRQSFISAGSKKLQTVNVKVVQASLKTCKWKM